MLSPNQYPLFAPLSVPLAEHLIVRIRRLDRYKCSEQEACHLLLQQLHAARWSAFFTMAPFVLMQQRGEPGGFSTGWLLQHLNTHLPMASNPITAQTLSQWRTRGLIWYQAYGVPDADAAAALLMARMIDRGERNFLPSQLPAGEQGWYCWVQTAPDAAPIPYRADRLHELSTVSVCWTPWMGAAWQSAWLPVQEERLTSLRGAMRWSHLAEPLPADEALLRPLRSSSYRLSVHDLRQWDAQVITCSGLASPASPPVDPEFVQEVGAIILRKWVSPHVASSG